MRDLGQRLLIGLGAGAAVLMAIGYAFIAGNLAAPLGGDLGTFEIPGPAPATAAVLLDDGRPAFVVATRSDVAVVDARAPVAAGVPGRLVTWCDLDPAGIFVDPLDGTTWEWDGALRSGQGTDGLVRYRVRSSSEDATIVVGSEGHSAGVTSGERVAPDCPADTWVSHRPSEGEVFDPSVAADEEPPGWVWLEGTLVADGDGVRLCDGLGGGCATWASVAGIDPAQVPVPAPAGHFLGRVRDGAIVDLQFVPAAGGSR
ncbi:MAG: hypothetical protein KY392_04675 [Chloroflexi bacterium]|nr:hypothetical protein [Chloroflexota bacterium]